MSFYCPDCGGLGADETGYKCSTCRGCGHIHDDQDEPSTDTAHDEHNADIGANDYDGPIL